MQDSDVVAAIVAGDPDGLAEAYDRYAAPLYAWSRLTLPEPGAAQVVQDTFVIATTRLDALRDPAMLGPWLHAVARNESLRRTAEEPAEIAVPVEIAVPAQIAEPPDGLREQVLAVCADGTPAGRAYRVRVAYRAGAFGRGGFPKPIGPSGPRWWRGLRGHPRTAVAVAMAAVLAAVAAGVVPALAFGGRPQARAATSALGVPKVPAGRAYPGAAASAAAPSGPAAPSRRPASRQSQQPQQARPTVQALASARAQSAAPGIAAPPPPPATSSAPAPPVTQGYLVAAPDQLILLSAKGKTQGIFVLTAAGGPVGHFEITVPPDAADRLKVSPSAGSLPSGGQVQVTVTVNGAAPLDTYLTVDPGNVAIEVESVKA